MTFKQLPEGYGNQHLHNIYQHLERIEEKIEGLAQKVSNTHPGLGAEVRKLQTDFRRFSLKLGVYHVSELCHQAYNTSLEMRDDVKSIQEASRENMPQIVSFQLALEDCLQALQKLRETIKP